MRVVVLWILVYTSCLDNRVMVLHEEIKEKMLVSKYRPGETRGAGGGETNRAVVRKVRK